MTGEPVDSTGMIGLASSGRRSGQIKRDPGDGVLIGFQKVAQSIARWCSG